MKAAYCTLGCKVNKYETDAMTEILEGAGYVTVPFEEKADVYVINTCTVTQVADRKSRQMISRARREGGKVIVCGCMPQAGNAEEIFALGADAVIGTDGRKDILSITERILKGETGINMLHRLSFDTSYEELSVSRVHERTRANIKICDGCNMFCSYCIIPYARGPVRSRTMDSVLKEIEEISDKGTKEIILTGIHVASYGIDLGKERLIDLLERIEDIRGVKRIRLSSVEPSLLSEDFSRRASALSKLCPHFHVSLQSGSDTVLKRMNRRYTSSEYEGYIDNVRKYFDRPAITTDIIAGFQGETEGEFEETLAFAEKIGFSRIHAFPYSKRKGTKAMELKGDIRNSVKKERVR
nr:tRNA (N(6)-L-threonylcarbamoyladenosine(37)-C(2))-methylthiotransferase MtaB [Clostridia bacterium]